MHCPRIAEAYLVFLRMHIDIHLPRVEAQVEYEGRVTPVKQHILVGLPHRVADDLIADHAAVDEEILEIRLGTGKGRQRDPAIQLQGVSGRGFDGHQAVGELATAEPGQALAHSVVGIGRRQLIDGLAVVLQAHGHRRIAEGQALEQRLDMIELGAFGAQEFLARRHIVEQVAHLDGGAGSRGRSRSRGFFGASLEGPAVLVAFDHRSDAHARNRGDTGQGFASEAEAGNRLEILEAVDLAGGVAGQREREILARNAAAVVADADQATAALLDLHADIRGPGIQAVLHQFLDHGSRSFDHFAGGDLVDQVGREGLNAVHDGERGRRSQHSTGNEKRRATRRVTRRRVQEPERQSLMIWLRNSCVRSFCGLLKNSSGSFSSMI